MNYQNLFIALISLVIISCKANSTGTNLNAQDNNDSLISRIDKYMIWLYPAAAHLGSCTPSPHLGMDLVGKIKHGGMQWQKDTITLWSKGINFFLAACRDHLPG